MDRDRGEELHITREERTQERGVAGGYAAAMPATTFAIDRMRWSAIWSGTLVAIALMMILGAFGVAAGLYRPAGAMGAGVNWSAVGLWNAIWALISLFVGGFAAARLAAAPTTGNGVWHGVIVWALTLTLSVILGALGAAGIMGFLPAIPGAQAVDVSGSAWGFFIGALLGLAAAAGGGALGKRSFERPIEDQ